MVGEKNIGMELHDWVHKTTCCLTHPESYALICLLHFEETLRVVYWRIRLHVIFILLLLHRSTRHARTAVPGSNLSQAFKLIICKSSGELHHLLARRPGFLRRADI